MSTPTQQPAPDFGEPWQADKTWPQIICNKGGIHAMVDVFDKTPGLRERIIAAMNACAGMVDPAAEIQALRLAAPVWQPIETAPKIETGVMLMKNSMAWGCEDQGGHGYGPLYGWMNPADAPIYQRGDEPGGMRCGYINEMATGKMMPVRRTTTVEILAAPLPTPPQV